MFLSNCYRNTLRIAAARNLTTIAFPSISTGIYGYPIRQATEVAVRIACEYITTASSLNEIIFCCYSLADLKTYEEVLAEQDRR